MSVACPLAKAVVEWLHRSSDTSADVAATMSLKSPIIHAIASQCSPWEDCHESTGHSATVAHWASNFLLPCCRVIAADHRELWEILDVPDKAATAVRKGLVNLWNEQQAYKKAIACTAYLQEREEFSLVEEGEAQSPTTSATIARNAKELQQWLLKEMSVALKPKVSGSTKPHHMSSGDESRGLLPQAQFIEGNPNVFILPMAYTSDISTEDKNSTTERTVEDGSSDDADLGVVAEGSLHCARPVPPYTQLITVPRSKMFARSVLSGRCILYDACADVRGAWDAFPDDETILLMCFVFENFCIGAQSSSWRELLLGCPRCYPSVPTFWTLAELGELEGTTMIDDVLEKKASLSQFHHQLVTAMNSMPQIAQNILARWSQGDEEVQEAAEHQSQELTKTLLKNDPSTWFSLLFSEDRLHWARATFDSRAFNLNIDGAVTIALVPYADMINHGTRSDVIKRHVEPHGGPFVLTTGAALDDEHDVGRELMMSYGPLQSWELIMSYGFILNDDEENDNDRIPLPLSVDETVVDGDGPVEREYKRRRAHLIKQHGLLVGGSSLWIGHRGAPCAALLALVRLQLAEIEHFPLLEASPFSVFQIVDASLEQRVVLTLQNIVDVMLQDFTTSMEEDEALLRRPPTIIESEEGDGKEDNDDEDADDEPVSGNTKLAVQLRLRMKRMLYAAAEWCNATLESLS
ncbi:Hypothetical protein, putative [Bodo saltans]|uniref:Rubisco LSMT substrate-binding domain-containing protein n=1 Tax=Bodo saltans TaxID=75058 RepID=A0A0S4JJX6_BODSA|nr:Hypothetical protein, putative [Bodo saltans]|eukprot:CUG90245.1 Hypothetical protein, putative [Bodo saltans]